MPLHHADALAVLPMKPNAPMVYSRIAHPLFQAEGDGLPPISALQFRFGEVTLTTAKQLNNLWHSRFPDYGGCAARISHVAEFSGLYYAVAIWSNPSSTKLPQLSWLMLKRWAIADDAPPNTASRMMRWMVGDIRRKMPEVEMLVSYSDPDTHSGGIYRACNWDEGETTERTASEQGWHNRKRQRMAKNQPCNWVTRWTRRVRPTTTRESIDSPKTGSLF